MSPLDGVVILLGITAIVGVNLYFRGPRRSRGSSPPARSSHPGASRPAGPEGDAP